jgi:hypothetical protein
MDRVVAGDADFRIMLNPQTSKDVRVHAYLEVPIGFVTAPGYTLAADGRARFTQCLDVPLIAPAEPLALSDQFRALSTARFCSWSRVCARSRGVEEARVAASPVQLFGHLHAVGERVGTQGGDINDR